MLVQEMTVDECRAELQVVNFGRLACARDHQPYIVPVYFAFDGKHLYGITTPGQKIEWMRANPRVCLEVDARPSHDLWMSIVVLGRYEELPDAPEYGHVRAQALEILQKRTLWWEPACVPPERQARRAPIFYRIHIEEVTGRRATPVAAEANVDRP
ncbi:MAG: pyridoxamine 5'-phosphate oxidase family protein [Proteobacteria bacterium]|nr:pyridoxamine 5'-phosphate oxidase family protein [Pseudomonadota bacterium]